MKENYETPEVEVIEFEAYDVLNASEPGCGEECMYNPDSCAWYVD